MQSDLSPEQLRAFRGCWLAYQQRVAAARQRCATAAATATATAATASATTSTVAGSRDLLALLGSVQVLSGYSVAELEAWLELQSTLFAVLTPMQGCRIALCAQPYMPDGVQICQALFEDAAGGGGGVELLGGGGGGNGVDGGSEEVDGGGEGAVDAILDEWLA